MQAFKLDKSDDSDGARFYDWTMQRLKAYNGGQKEVLIRNGAAKIKFRAESHNLIGQ